MVSYNLLSSAFEEEEEGALTGVIEIGDYVKTLNRTRAIYGKVTDVHKPWAIIMGITQPGKPLERKRVNLEDLELTYKAGTLPPERKADYGE